MIIRKTTKQTDTPKVLFFIESPKDQVLDDRRIKVGGWVMPTGSSSVKEVLVHNNGRTFHAHYGLVRTDVADAYPDINSDTATNCGFMLEIEFEDGELSIEAVLEDEVIRLETLNIKYTGDKPLSSFYNPYLASNTAHHNNLIKSKIKYFFEEAIKNKYVRDDSDPKVVSFYLPQFHPIPENDKAWGKGFTEWTNVTTAQPKFVGHYQPILPRDLGFYDLRLKETIYDQVNLAKQHGLYGFCFYYYWFSGKKLLDTPINIFLESKEWDFNFMICWANENWTKKWDGKDSDVIVEQQYFPNDPIEFIKDVESILVDPRYIRVNDRPVLAVYRASELKNPERYTRIWREYFRKKYNEELHLISVLSFEAKDPGTYGFDAAVDFVPQAINFRNKTLSKKMGKNINIRKTLLDIKFEGTVFDYRKIALNNKFHEAPYSFKTYPCTMPSWDNDARRKGKGSVFYYQNPDLYAEWLDKSLSNREDDASLVFVNAWNEWGEGAVLEPTLHYGHATLNRTTEIIAKHSKNNNLRKKFPPYQVKRSQNTEIAVIVHLYYIEQWEYINQRLKKLPENNWDLYVTLNQANAGFSRTIKKEHKNATINIVPNQGRDMLPFVHLARRLEKCGYKGFLKLHSKKSTHRGDGEDWFKELVDNLLPSKLMTKKIMKKTINGNVLIGQKGHYVSLKAQIGNNEDRVKELLTKVYGRKQESKEIFDNPKNFAHFAGSMFWVSVDTIKPILDLYLMPEDFEPELGQTDGTTAHAVERIITLVAHINNNEVLAASHLGLKKVNPHRSIQDYKYTRT